MKPVFLVVAVVGLIAAAAGAYLAFMSSHHKSGYAALVVGVVLLIGGLVASFVGKNKSEAAS